ncbi:hypothetical protein LguiB_018495 [Lonicera macranthoides]
MYLTYFPVEFFDEIWWRCSTHDEEYPHKISSKNFIGKRAKQDNPYRRSVNSGPHEIRTHVPAPAPAPSSYGAAIYQGIAYVLMMLPLVLTYNIH